MGIVQALTHHEAETAPDSEDPRLRGRRYGVPFHAVWVAALELAGTLPRWRVVETSPTLGDIRVEARSRVLGRVVEVAIHVRLDDVGATRVDVRSASRKWLGDLGANARRIDSFLRRLDRALSGRR